jgi:hypothetical protein
MVKTEMKILPNGNYESVVCPIQHECRSENGVFRCAQYSWDDMKLTLYIEDGDPYEDGYETHIHVSFCPFCGIKSGVSS